MARWQRSRGGAESGHCPEPCRGRRRGGEGHAGAKPRPWPQNIHLVARWLGTLDKKVERYSLGSHEDYRVFISAEPAPSPESHIIPQGILENAIKITNEPPTGMHANLHKALDLFTQVRRPPPLGPCPWGGPRADALGSQTKRPSGPALPGAGSEPRGRLHAGPRRSVPPAAHARTPLATQSPRVPGSLRHAV